KRLCISFKPHGSCTLPLKYLSNQDLEQLLLSLEVLTDKAVWTPRLIEFRDEVQNENRGITGWSFTQLWEEELERRFNSTTFFPLEPGRVVASGRLKILRQLAFGGFSAVYIAEDQNTNTVVLKESVVSEDSPDPAKKKALELFNREAILLSQ